MGKQLTPRTSLFMGLVLGVIFSLLFSKAAEHFFGYDSTPRQLTADLSLDDTYKYMGIANPPVSGTLHAGFRYTIAMKKGFYTYVSFTTMIPTERLEAVSRPAETP